MKDFLIYFLGEGETAEFHYFTLAHFLPIMIAAAIIFLIYRYRQELALCKRESTIRHILAFIMILSDMTYYWRLVALPELGPNPLEHLPITVCGLAIIMCSYMMVGKNQTLFDIVYFWFLCGSVFALITPAVITYTGPTRFRYYQFWTEHLIGFVGIFYMIFVHKMRPTWRSMGKAYVALAVLAVVAYNVNRMLGPGANYLFMAEPSETPTVLDILPPIFLLRLVVMILVISLMFFLVYLPWFIKDKKTKKAATLQ